MPPSSEKAYVYGSSVNDKGGQPSRKPFRVRAHPFSLAPLLSIPRPASNQPTYAAKWVSARNGKTKVLADAEGERGRKED